MLYFAIQLFCGDRLLFIVIFSSPNAPPNFIPVGNLSSSFDAAFATVLAAFATIGSSSFSGGCMLSSSS